MKHKLLFLLILSLVVNIQPVKSQIQSRVYDYPVKPGTKEWRNLSSINEKLNAYNIPDALLKNMSTSDLVQTCLNYPELRLIMTRNSLQLGYNYLKSIFNGFRELEKRTDAGSELINAYVKLNPVDIKTYDTPVKRGQFAFKIKYNEILLAQKPILLNLDKEGKKKLLRKSISNFEVIQKMPDDFATFGLMTPALVLGRLLKVNAQQDFITKESIDTGLQRFVDRSDMEDVQTLTDILSFSKVYLKILENQ